jgi:hypothetical protein
MGREGNVNNLKGGIMAPTILMGSSKKGKGTAISIEGGFGNIRKRREGNAEGGKISNKIRKRREGNGQDQ